MDRHRLRWEWRRVPFGDKLNVGVSLLLGALAIVLSVVAVQIGQEQTRLSREQGHLAEKQIEIAERQDQIVKRQAEIGELQFQALQEQFSRDAVVRVMGVYPFETDRLALYLRNETIVDIAYTELEFRFSKGAYSIACGNNSESIQDLPTRSFFRSGTPQVLKPDEMKQIAVCDLMPASTPEVAAIDWYVVTKNRRIQSDGSTRITHHVTPAARK